MPPGRPCRHHLHGPHQRGRLPVAFGAEAVAVGHEPLHGQPGQLRQPVQVLEGVGEGLETAAIEETPQAQLDAGRVAQRLRVAARRGAAPGPCVYCWSYWADEAVDVGVATASMMRRSQLAHAVAVDFHAQADLGLDLVAFGHGHLPHVVAQPGDFQGGAVRASRRPPASRRPGALAPRRPASGRRPPCAACRIRVQMKPNSRSPWAAWLRFMKSMSIVAQGRSRLNCVCRWANGLSSAVQAGDPHLGRREGVHPADHARRNRPPRWPRGRLRGSSSAVVTTGLKHHADRQPARGVEPLDDVAAVAGHLPQRPRAVEMLAAGDKPDFPSD